MNAVGKLAVRLPRQWDLVATLLFLLPLAVVQAQTTIALEDLAQGPDQVSLDYVALDLSVVFLSGSDHWISSGLLAETLNGATLVYAMDADSEVTLVRPDQDGEPLTDAEKYVTFVSRPRGQDAARRYRANGVPGLSGDFPGGGPAQATHDEVSVSFGSEDDSESSRGYVSRVLIDVQGSPITVTPEAYAKVGTGPRNPGDMKLLAGRARATTGQGSEMIEFSIYAPADCNGNGVADVLEDVSSDPLLQDCNENGTADGCDLYFGAADLNGNQVPDECEDCDGDGVLDHDQIANCPPGDIACADCDGNGIPDGCDVAPQTVTFSSGIVPLLNDGQDLDLGGALPPAAGPVDVQVRIRADVQDATQHVALYLNGLQVGDLFTEATTDCRWTTETVVVPAEMFNALGVPTLGLVGSTQLFNIQSSRCSDSRIELTVSYATTVIDCNADGVPDDCQPGLDCDADGICDLALLQNCPPGETDCGDCNGNGIPDRCDIVDCPPGDPNCTDCNGNGIPDGCELRDCPPDETGCADCDGNGVLDGCETWPRVVGPQGPLSAARPVEFRLDTLAPSSSSVSFTAALRGQFDAHPRNIELFFGATPQGALGWAERAACEMITASLSRSAPYFNSALDGEELVVRLVPTETVSYACQDSMLELTLDYNRRTGPDCNTNGVPDACEDLPDCDGDGVPDACVFRACISDRDCDDCNQNGIPDSCDIANCPPGDLSCGDLNGNRIPDGCETDCNGNGIPDDVDIDVCDPNDPSCQDCDNNRIPDGCDLAACPDDDPNCGDCNGSGIPDRCELLDFALFDTGVIAPVSSGQVISLTGQAAPLAADFAYVALFFDGWQVDEGDAVATLSINGIDIGAVRSVRDRCEDALALISLPAPLLNRLVGPAGLVDVQISLLDVAEPCSETQSAQITLAYYLNDCDRNRRLDSCDIASGVANDADGDGLPDSCTPDCDGNGIPDYLDIYEGRLPDCNLNGIPDACDLETGPSDPNDFRMRDCDGNGVLDFCEMRDCPPGDPGCTDCDGNQLLDACQPDCDDDGIPDDCELAACAGLTADCRDCNENGIPDACEIADCDGDPACSDCDENGWLDVCEVERYSRTHENVSVSGRFRRIPYPVGDAVFTFEGTSDLDADDEYVYVSFRLVDGSGYLGFHVFVDGNGECLPSVDSIRMTPEELLRIRTPNGRIDYYWNPTGINRACYADSFAVHLDLLGSNDCNGNGIPDTCDVATGSSPDANGTGLPDECEDDCDLDGVPDADVVGFPFERTWTPRIDRLGIVVKELHGLPAARGDVTLTLGASSNLGDPQALILILDPWISSPSIEAFDDEQQPDCTLRSETHLIPAGLFNELRSPGGSLWLSLYHTRFERVCPEDNLTVTLAYTADLGLDCDANGVPDECTLAAGGEDCNGNGVLDLCEVAPPVRRAGTRWPVLDEYGFGASYIFNVPPSEGPILLRLHVAMARRDEPTPVYMNGIWVGEFALAPSGEGCREITREFTVDPDVLADALVFWDGLEVTIEPDRGPACNASYLWAEVEFDAVTGNDCNGNGRVDSCDIADSTSFDLDGDGVPDECVFVCQCDADINGNEAVDINDLATILGNFELTGATRVDGDVSGDGQVYWEDLARALRFFGCVCDD